MVGSPEFQKLIAEIAPFAVLHKPIPKDLADEIRQRQNVFLPDVIKLLQDQHRMLGEMIEALLVIREENDRKRIEEESKAALSPPPPEKLEGKWKKTVECEFVDEEKAS
jgi:hypothetical protein